MKRYSAALLALIGLLAACSDHSFENSGDPTESFSLLVVELKGAESRVLEQRLITRGDQWAAREAGVLQQGLTTWFCTSTSVQLFDQANYTGNQICFVGLGTANLVNYPRSLFGNWQAATRSWKAGNTYGGKFKNAGNRVFLFSPNDQQASATAVVASSTQLTIDSELIPDMVSNTVDLAQ